MKLTRRRFVGACLGIFGGVAARRSGVSDRPPVNKSFYVAGVRFHAIPPSLKVGDRVFMYAATYNGTKSLAICDSCGRRIGYVPRALVRQFDGQLLSGARVSKLDSYAVPWKKLQISL
ncbi:MAG: hypothetical protein DMG88_08630 [Acidobacteria bacterium]|nr:MAG: hypothetical protein DMG88_08630 [Acidobacteriota bacterium]